MFKGPYGATPLHPDERVGLKHRHITTKAELNELEAENIYLGLAWLDARGPRFDPLDRAQACDLHRRLFGEVWRWAGKYRQTEKNIGAPVWSIAADMEVLLGDARCWVENGTYENPVEGAAYLHHRLVKIHPFPNGNGRWARIMADAFLAVCFGRPPIDWAHGVDLQADSARRLAYITALRAADEYDFDPLLEFVGI